MNGKRKSIIIIGAGISGLASGIYALMNGYKVKIYEQHFIPGGMCTAWQRGKYKFDMCIDWLLGSRPGGFLNLMWQEVGALDGKKIYNFDFFNCVKSKEGKELKFYVDPFRLEEHLKEISPADSEAIEDYCYLFNEYYKIRDYLNYYLPIPQKFLTLKEKLKMFLGLKPYFPLLGRTSDELLKDYAKKFKDPFISEAIKYLMYVDHTDFPMLPVFYNFSQATARDAGFPEGGSLGLVKSMEKKFLSWGGEILYEKKVKKILTDKNKATGIVIEDGSKYYADIIVSAADGRALIYDMLDGKYTDKTFERLFTNLVDKQPEMIYPSVFIAFLGVDMDLSGKAHSTTYLLDESEVKQLTGIQQSMSLLAQIRTNYSKEFAPAGKSVIALIYFSDYATWDKIHARGKDIYNKEKERIGNFLINYMDKVYPGLKEKTETMDLSTPVTIKRYTGNSNGSIMAWKPFGEADESTRKLAEKYGMKLPGLKNLYITGQWISLGGLIRNVASARQMMHFLCRDDKKKFKSDRNIKLFQ